MKHHMHCNNHVTSKLNCCRIFQAIGQCTSIMAKKVVVGLALFTVTIVAAFFCCSHFKVYLFNFSYILTIYGVLPATILVINLIVVYKVRRSSHHAVTNLGLQRHHQTTLSNSAVPTVTLVTISLVYVALCGTWSTVKMAQYLASSALRPKAAFSPRVFVAILAAALMQLVFAYNFYIYLITSKQFRSDLYELFYKLFRYCSSSPS